MGSRFLWFDVVSRQTLVRRHKAQWTLQKNFVTVPVRVLAVSVLYFTRSEMKLWLFLRLSPLPPQLLFQLYTFSTGGEGQGEGGEGTSKTLTLKEPQSAPLEV